jgi:hypothetical protein
VSAWNPAGWSSAYLIAHVLPCCVGHGARTITKVILAVGHRRYCQCGWPMIMRLLKAVEA